MHSTAGGLPYWNTAVGTTALYNINNGNYNIAIGANAGSNIVDGSYNIDIGNAAASSDSGIVRIGTSGKQHQVYIQGIYEKPVSGAAVVVDSEGQLGVVVSSERFKTDVKRMKLREDVLERLQPVTFHLKSNPDGPLQYGLIAEEVEKVDPNLVIRSKDGRIDGVRYDEITPLLLKQIQTQNAKIAKQERQLADQNAKIARLESQFASVQAAVRQGNAPSLALASH